MPGKWVYAVSYIYGNVRDLHSEAAGATYFSLPCIFACPRPYLFDTWA